MRVDSRGFHSLQSISISCFHVILGLTGPHFPSICRSEAVLIALLECSTCPYQWNLLSFRMRSRSSMPSYASSSLDLVVTMSCGLTLQLCLIIALSFRCRHWRFGFFNDQVSLAWSIALLHRSCTCGHLSWKRGGGKRELVTALWTSFLHRLVNPFFLEKKSYS